MTLDENKLRYGISALDVSHKDYAVNDELLVNGANGKMLYKRNDGQIVTYETHEYNKGTLINAINYVLLDTKNVEMTNSDYLIYNIFDITNKENEQSNNLLSTEKNILNYTEDIIIDRSIYGIFLRIRGNSVTNAVASYLQHTFNINNPDNTSKSVIITMDITNLDSNVKITRTIEVDFNKLVFIKGDEVSNKGFKVNITSIQYAFFNDVFKSLDESIQKELKSLNYDNPIFESSYIDFIYYNQGCQNSVIYNETDRKRLQFVIRANEVEKDSFVMSKYKPEYKCLWANENSSIREKIKNG